MGALSRGRGHHRAPGARRGRGRTVV